MASKSNRSGTSIKPEPHELDSENKEILAMLIALETEDKLNTWEIDFITSVAERWYNKKPLTVSQIDKLREVYRRYN